MIAASTAGAHTLPISFLRLVPDADYLHLELVLNPFELTFMSEVDLNNDHELSPAELSERGQIVADRVTGALKITVAGAVIRAETCGMDPDLNGHHVRVRAHYKVDARERPLMLESDLISIMSASHLTQVTYAQPEAAQRAQLDAFSRKVTFTPPPTTKQTTNPTTNQPPPPAPRGSAASGGIAPQMGGLMALAASAAFLLFVLRRSAAPKAGPEHAT